jgi:hypothetical protein
MGVPHGEQVRALEQAEDSEAVANGAISERRLAALPI